MEVVYGMVVLAGDLVVLDNDMEGILMKLTWVIEPEMWEGHAEAMSSAVASLGQSLRITDVALEKPLPDLEGNVVVHGSFELARKVIVEVNWNPGVICMLDNYRWTTYAKKLSPEILLNRGWEVSTTSRLVELAESQKLEGCFVRPDAGNKSFGGTAFIGNRILWPAMARMFLRTGGDIPIIISSLKEIGDEYRLVVVGENVVAGSRYMRNGDIDIESGAPAEAVKMAERALLYWRPDSAFVIDVAETDDGYKVVEYNAFSTADWYGCDLLPILKAIGEQLEGVFEKT